MVKIDKNLSLIRGMDTAILKQLAEQGILTVSDLQQNTMKPKDREELAKKINVDIKTLYIWAKQAELMRVDGIDEINSEMLVKSGIRNVKDLADADTRTLMQLLDVTIKNDSGAPNKVPSIAISTNELEAWQKAASALMPLFEVDSDDKALEVLFTKTNSDGKAAFIKLDYAEVAAKAVKETELKTNELVRPDKPLRFSLIEEPKVKEGGFFFSLSEMMVDIGRGVAKAQHELDMSSIEIQKYIDSHETLSNYGLSATWYVMPETSFQIKVDYSVVREETEDGTKETATLPARLRVAPVNAKYQNYFKRSANMESELSFKIVPVPPPVRFTEVVFVPDLIGLSLEEAKQLISESRLLIGDIISISEKTENGKETQVVSQSKEPGTEAAVNDVINIAYMKEG
ncbi:MAG: DUF4332 domain-containing protein [Clostridiales bacterium]|nr:DUF4332 domain-containing protein [Clostridiales bacterium]